ncbi:MAG TPA: DNA polymerase III subunit beta [Rhabdochlamydiaceae bacterium]|nr:DNA polymerase III subunit beta [Rhabdochlamydiaceae bacterium]
MKVLVSRIEFVALIGKIQSIVSQRPSIPILSNVLLEAANDELILSATDLTVSMRTSIAAKVEEEGSITLPARRLFQLVRELTSPQIEIESLSPESVMLHSGTSHFKIQGMHKNEFPAIPDLANGVQITLNSLLLKEMLNKTSFAAARDDSRQVLNGVLFQKQGHLFSMTGTDGKRLSKVEAEIESPGLNDGSYILPLKAVEEIIKLIENRDEPVILRLTTDKIGIELSPTTLVSKLLAGPYPDVTRVIPQKINSPISLHREELITLLRQVSLFTSELSSSVRFSFSQGALHLAATSGDIGEGKVHMPANYSGPKLEIAFNPHFFLDILRHSKDETVEFNVSDSYNPGLVTDSSKAQFVIMPMRLE